MLVLEPYAREHAKQQPQTLVAAFDDLDGDKRGAHPEERLERIHRQQVVEAEIKRRRNHRNARQDLRVGPRAQLARNQPREQDLQPRCKRWQEAQRVQRISQRHALKPRGRRNQRSLIHVAPVQMMAARQVVQLVHKVAIAAIEQHVQRKEGQREPCHHSKASFLRAMRTSLSRHPSPCKEHSEQ